jgi:hypothetical protein
MLNVYYRSDVAVIGRTEDGDVTGHVFYLVAEDDSGARIAHFNRTRDEEEASDLKDKVSAFVEAGGKLDPTYWNDIDPRYGSEFHARIGDRHLMTESEIFRRDMD